MIGGTPLSHIESRNDVQGGRYCLRGTRIPLYRVVESLESGSSLRDCVETYRKYGDFTISEEELNWAVLEYRREILMEKPTKQR